MLPSRWFVKPFEEWKKNYTDTLYQEPHFPQRYEMANNDNIYNSTFGLADIKKEGGHYRFDVSGAGMDSKEGQPWARDIPDEIMQVPLSTLVELWHLRFSEAPTPAEVKGAGDFYYQASRRLWVERLLQKQKWDTPAGVWPEQDLRFVVCELIEDGEGFMVPTLVAQYANS